MRVLLFVYVSVMQSHDPSTNVVLLEDAAAVLGVVIAAGCMGLTSLTGECTHNESVTINFFFGVIIYTMSVLTHLSCYIIYLHIHLLHSMY